MPTTSASVKIINDSIVSKYAVAEILSSMPAATETFVQANTSVNGFSSGISHLPTLTPTTLNTIEQTINQIQNASEAVGNAAVKDSSRESGFVPPIIQPIATMPVPVQVKDESENFDEQNFQIQQDLEHYCGKRQKTGPASYTVPEIDPKTFLVANSKRPTGPRKQKNDNVSGDEAQKKAERRERNKLAAAKCRKRREDHTSQLINETEGLEEKKVQLETEIQSLHQQIDQLEFILQAHTPECQALKQQQKPTANTSSHLQVKRTTQGSKKDQSRGSIRPNTLPIGGKQVETTGKSSASNSLVTETLNISTPGIMKVFNFDTMVEGHTGLTPLTEISTSISTPVSTTHSTSQQKKKSDSTAANEMSSPATLVLL